MTSLVPRSLPDYLTAMKTSLVPRSLPDYLTAMKTSLVPRSLPDYLTAMKTSLVPRPLPDYLTAMKTSLVPRPLPDYLAAMKINWSGLGTRLSYDKKITTTLTIHTAQVVLNASVTHPAATRYPPFCLLTSTCLCCH